MNHRHNHDNDNNHTQIFVMMSVPFILQDNSLLQEVLSLHH
jgi:hypothetical protein